MSRGLTTEQYHYRTGATPTNGVSVKIPGTTEELIKWKLKQLGSHRPQLSAIQMHDESHRNAYAYVCGQWDEWVGLQQSWTEQQEQLSHGKQP